MTSVELATHFFVVIVLLLICFGIVMSIICKMADRVNDRQTKRYSEEVETALRVFDLVNQAVGGDLSAEEFGQAQKYIENKYHLAGREGVIIFRKCDAGQLAVFVRDAVIQLRKTAAGVMSGE